MHIRFTDMILGIAIGDAFGAGLEFQDRHWIRQHVDFTRFINKRSDINTTKKEVFLIDYHEWDYTDDTEMSIAICKAIMSGKELSEELLIAFFLEEYNYSFKKNGYKRNGHGAIRTYYQGTSTIDEIKDFQRNRDYPGNAPPMRAIPIGFYNESEIEHLATMNANCTHPHPKAIASSIAIARAAHGLLCKSISQEEIIDYVLPFISDDETQFLLNAANKLPRPDQLKEDDYLVLCGKQPIEHKELMGGMYGLPGNAMYTAVSALYFIKHSKDAFEGLRYSIQLGGDVDSLAAIVVGVLSAKYGIESLPQFMLNSVEDKPYLESLGQAFGEWYLNRKANAL
jgi:ADP-ribosylglycohydrolase